MAKLVAARGTIIGPVITNTVFNLNDVVTTPLADDFCGLLLIGVTTDSALGLYLIANGTGADILASSVFSMTKDTDSKYNGYFEGGFLKIQNKVGNSKTLKISAMGLESRTA